ncbi:HNH nuclease [uncultured Caudovirales phage]|uniref:HNH nuclease n=1 Tax=uncultured Caudovirales phage TaxID=2100421 RepID=A0A6J5LSU6_9CAUD|nr:HNH nuclease [uncultured Caudovirales phage]
MKSEIHLIEAAINGLCYNPETGAITKEMGYVTRYGYRVIHFHNKGTIPAHRLAWFMHYGVWPDGEVDHIDGDRANNAIANLRCVSKSLNQRNRAVGVNNSTGFLGVYLNKASGKYVAQWVGPNGRRRKGGFETAQAAFDHRLKQTDGLGYVNDRALRGNEFNDIYCKS